MDRADHMHDVTDIALLLVSSDRNLLANGERKQYP